MASDLNFIIKGEGHKQSRTLEKWQCLGNCARYRCCNNGPLTGSDTCIGPM